MTVDTNKLFIRESDVIPYEPSGHTGTVNRRLVGQEQGAKHLEIVIGTIDPGEGATPHFHPGIDQFCYMLDGEAEVTIGKITRVIGPGEACFFPAEVSHVFVAKGEKPIRVLVAYGPPYGEGARVDL
ncbi:cupin domain-containing protein [uncultured Ruegeria sp.]|uniref:cupin domain-containing protein n=1 Tax=uncultured Ruegeria sp. TaxID=259304 RepID=UPI00262CD5B3|nr:cupin domain-containing protein [uncultured Ruegeria sp.]